MDACRLGIMPMVFDQRQGIYLLLRNSIPLHLTDATQFGLHNLILSFLQGRTYAKTDNMSVEMTWWVKLGF